MPRALIPTLILVSLLSFPEPAPAAWSLGANLGLTIHDPSESGDDTVTLLGAPTQGNVFSSLRPGLRVGFTGESMDHEGYVDFSYDGQFADGDNIHALRLGANYQYNFSVGGSARPYVTAGAGIFNVGAEFGGESVGATSLTYGGGVGIGLPVSDNGGRLRFEARFDKLDEGEDADEIVIGEANIVQVTFGFDLWIR